MANRFSEVLAGLPQVPRETFCCLRESRKCLEKLFGVCGSPASVSRNFLVFAGVPQVSRETFWCLRESRKCLEKLFGVCGSPASVSRNFLVFAGSPQTFSVFLSAIKRQLPVRTESLTGSISNDNVRAEKLSAVEIFFHQRQHFLGLAFDIGTECLVLVATQIGQDAVDHARAEHVVCLEHFTLLLEAVG